MAKRKESGTGPAAAESAEMLKKRNRLLEQKNEILRWAAAYLARGTSTQNDAPIAVNVP